MATPNLLARDAEAFLRAFHLLCADDTARPVRLVEAAHLIGVDLDTADEFANLLSVVGVIERVDSTAGDDFVLTDKGVSLMS